MMMMTTTTTTTICWSQITNHSSPLKKHHYLSFYSSFRLAMRADRRPPGVITLPVFFSMGVPGVPGVAAADLVTSASNWTLFSSFFDEILDMARTNRNPINPAYIEKITKQCREFVKKMLSASLCHTTSIEQVCIIRHIIILFHNLQQQLEGVGTLSGWHPF